MRQINFRLLNYRHAGFAFLWCVLAIVLLGCSENNTPSSPPNNEPPDDDMPADPGPIAAVEITPEMLLLSSLRERAVLTVRAVDADGREVAGAVFEWASSDRAVASVSADSDSALEATIFAFGNGSAIISATTAGIEGTITVTVQQKVAAIFPFSEAAAEFPGDTARIQARAEDRAGKCHIRSFIQLGVQDPGYCNR